MPPRALHEHARSAGVGTEWRRSGFWEVEQVAELFGVEVVGVVDHDACFGGEVEGRHMVEDGAADDSVDGCSDERGGRAEPGRERE